MSNQNKFSGMIAIRYEGFQQLEKMKKSVSGRFERCEIIYVSNTIIQPYEIQLEIEIDKEKFDCEKYFDLEANIMGLTETHKTQAHLCLSDGENYFSKVFEMGSILFEFQSSSDLDELLSHSLNYYQAIASLNTYTYRRAGVSGLPDTMSDEAHESIEWHIRNRKDFRDWYTKSKYFLKGDSLYRLQSEYSELIDAIREEKGGVKFDIYMGTSCREISTELLEKEIGEGPITSEQLKILGEGSLHLMVDDGIENLGEIQASAIISRFRDGQIELKQSIAGKKDSWGCLGVFSVLAVSGFILSSFVT